MPENHLDQALLYEAGELPPPEHADFERHVTACPECRELLKLAHAGHRWANAAQEEPSSELLASTLSQHGRGAGLFPGLWFRIPRAAAVMAFASIIAMLVVSRKAKPAPAWDSDLSQRIWTAGQKLENIQDDIQAFKKLRRNI